MEEKNFTLLHLIGSILLTVFIIFLFWENDASHLRENISIKDEKIQELEQTLEEEKPNIQQQLDEIQSILNTIYDGITVDIPLVDEYGNQLTVKH